jgi:asparaginyl-tRNA synthetase
MIEPEIAFADLEDNMEIAEGMLKYAFGYVLEHAQAELEFFDRFIMP